MNRLTAMAKPYHAVPRKICRRDVALFGTGENALASQGATVNYGLHIGNIHINCDGPQDERGQHARFLFSLIECLAFPREGRSWCPLHFRKIACVTSRRARPSLSTARSKPVRSSKFSSARGETMRRRRTSLFTMPSLLKNTADGRCSTHELIYAGRPFAPIPRCELSSTRS